MRTYTRTALISIVSVAAFWLAGETSLAAGKLKSTAEFSDIQVNQTVEVEGRPLPGGTILASEIKILQKPGSEESKFTAQIDSIDREKLTIGLMGLAGVKIHVPPPTVIVDRGPADPQTGKTTGDGPLIAFANLKRAQWVRVKVLSRDGRSFEAIDIKVQEPKKYAVQIEGPVKEIDTAKRAIIMSGFTIQTNQQTSMKSE
jgi:hypothetical protein